MAWVLQLYLTITWMEGSVSLASNYGIHWPSLAWGECLSTQYDAVRGVFEYLVRYSMVNLHVALTFMWKDAIWCMYNSHAYHVKAQPPSDSPLISNPWKVMEEIWYRWYALSDDWWLENREQDYLYLCVSICLIVCYLLTMVDDHTPPDSKTRSLYGQIDPGQAQAEWSLRHDDNEILTISSTTTGVCLTSYYLLTDRLMGT